MMADALIAEPRYISPKKGGRSGRPAYYTAGNDAYLGTVAAARHLNISRIAFWRWVRDGKLTIPTYQIGEGENKIRTWKLSDLENLRRARGAVTEVPATPTPAVGA
jgi:hypothetical protein